MLNKILLSVISTLIIYNPAFSLDIEQLWGISKTDLISGSKLENYSVFKPEEKTDYSNRIIDFFSSMNPGKKSDITVLRIQGRPEIDYCFFNEKLYSISEEWGDVNRTRADDILKDLQGKYPAISTEEKNLNIIYSFKKNRTKILLYKKVTDEKSVHIRIFYYSSDLFGMLFRE